MLTTARQRWTRRGLALASTTLAALLCSGAPSALAAEVLGAADTPVFTAAAGESNDVTVTQTAENAVTFHDANQAITTAVADCVATAGDVTCTTAGVTSFVQLILDDGNDQTTFATVTAPVIQDGGTGADTLRASDRDNEMAGGEDGDTFVGGPGTETVTYASSAAGVTASIDGVANDGVPGENDNIGLLVDAITGSVEGDHLTGNDSANTLDGGDGNDDIDGAGGDDTLRPGSGTQDIVRGGAGTADVVEVQEAGDVVIKLDDVANDGLAGDTDDVRSDVESVIMAAGSDTVVGSAAANGILGGDGNDDIDGGTGGDVLSGEGGNDTIRARDGIADMIFCGDDVDTVIADSLDTLVDAAACEDKQIATPTATIAPASHAFGNQDTGTASASRVVTVTNTGVVPVVITTTPVTGAGFSSVTDTCANATVPPNQTCQITVRFAPTAAGSSNGSLTITDNVPGAPLTVSLSGTGTTPTPPPPPPPGDTGAGTTVPTNTGSGTRTPTTTPTTNSPAPTTSAARVAPAGLSLALVKSRDRTRPYRFSIRGEVRMPAGVTKPRGCASGSVTVTGKRGTRRVFTRTVSLRANCTYSVAATIRGRGKLKFTARFAGNGVLQAKSSPARSARAG